MRTIRPGELTHGVNPDDYPDYTVHGVYPWSVLRSDSREWQHRKKHWISRRVHEHDGRDDHLLIGAGRIHQRVVTVVKGDRRRATAATRT